MRQRLLVLLAAVCAAAAAFAVAPSCAQNGPSSYELLDYDPVANPAAVVTAGNARFTVLTSQLIRMEFHTNAQFEDRATLAFVNRNLTVPKFTSSTNNNVLTIATNSLQLTYQVGQPFSSSTLSIKSLDATSAFTSWKYGDVNSGNLLGTIKSLDMLGVQTLNCTLNANTTVHDESLHCEWGLVSRDGWSVVDDSHNWALTKGAEWWDSENVDDMDLYFFGYGHEYLNALADFVKVGGKIAMVPRYMSGIMFTRWYNLNNLDVKEYVNDYSTRGFPLDVFIFDMNWHTKYHWGGYTPDPNLLPFPDDTFSFLHNSGLHIGANLHDDDGVHNTEQTFVQMCQKMGLDPDSTSQIPFSAVNKTYVYSLEDVVLDSVPIDFWWIDWQQGGTQGGCAGGKQNPTIWTDKIRSTDPKRQGKNKRSAVLARWGGLGTHRYQVGFSGDVDALTWANLAYQPYFSFTASNVGYGFWSHDIEGPSSNLELYTRWLQWGSVSAVMRSHDRGMSGGACADAGACSIVRPWNVPLPFERIHKKALLDRAELLPYIYTQHRTAFDIGLSITRPMYYYFPEADMAYKGDQNGNFPQYMFGPDMLISPIVSPANTTSRLTEHSVWLPQGTWVERDTGVLHVVTQADFVLTKSYDLSEIPVFIAGGAVIPTHNVNAGDTIGTASRDYDSLTFNIYPGANDWTTKVYEDDGLTRDYLDDKYVWTSVQYTRTASKLTVTISSKGSYSSFPSQRPYTVNVVNSLPIASATVNGKSLKGSRFGGPETFTFDGNTMTASLTTHAVATNTPTTIAITFIDSVDAKALSGIRGMISHANLGKRYLDEARITPGSQKPQGGNLMSLASSGEALSYVAANEPNNFNWYLNRLQTFYKAALDELINGPTADPAPLPDNVLFQQYSSGTLDSVLCGTINCLTENPDTTRLRVEGYMPPMNAPNTTPLFIYWNQVQTQRKDNLVTTSTQVPGGYVSGDYANNGQVFTSQSAASGLIPLQLWYKSSINDHLTVASDQGVNYAKSNGYELVDGNLGYVYKNDPNAAQPMSGTSRAETRAVGSGSARFDYAIALLQNALN